MCVHVQDDVHVTGLCVRAKCGMCVSSCVCLRGGGRGRVPSQSPEGDSQASFVFVIPSPPLPLQNQVLPVFLGSYPPHSFIHSFIP